MAEILDLIGPVMAATPGAPEPVVHLAYVDAARTFFRETRAWVTDVALGDEYLPGAFELELPEDTAVTDLLQVQYQGTPVRKRTKPQMDRMPARTDTRPTGVRAGPDRIYFAPRPTALGQISADDVEATAALYPTRSATVLEGEQADRFGEIIEAGALARLLLMPNRPWSEARSAATYHQIFHMYIDTWRSRAADGGMVGVARQVRYRDVD